MVNTFHLLKTRHLADFRIILHKQWANNWLSWNQPAQLHHCLTLDYCNLNISEPSIKPLVIYLCKH